MKEWTNQVTEAKSDGIMVKQLLYQMFEYSVINNDGYSEPWFNNERSVFFRECCNADENAHTTHVANLF